MRLVMCSLLMFVLLISTQACSEELEPRTQLMAVIDVEAELRSEVRRLHVRVSGRAVDDSEWGPAKLDQEYAKLEWPFRVAIVPDADDVRRRVLVEAIAVSESGEELLLLRAVTGFLPGRTLAVPMLFERLCLHRSCTAALETCRAGICESAELDPKRLSDLRTFNEQARRGDSAVPGTLADAGQSELDSSLTTPDTEQVQSEAGLSSDASQSASDAAPNPVDAAVPQLDAGDAATARPTLCGTAAEKTSPGSDCRGIVTCGNATAPCDLSEKLCCTSAFTDIGGECSSATGCGLNARTSCDGPEDCPGATICCFEGGGASCQTSCVPIHTMCHLTSDCSEGVCAAGSVGGPFWVYWGFCRMP